MWKRSYFETNQNGLKISCHRLSARLAVERNQSYPSNARPLLSRCPFTTRLLAVLLAVENNDTAPKRFFEWTLKRSRSSAARIQRYFDADAVDAQQLPIHPQIN